MDNLSLEKKFASHPAFFTYFLQFFKEKLKKFKGNKFMKKR